MGLGCQGQPLELGFPGKLIGVVCQNIPIGKDFSGKCIKAGCQDNTIGSGCQSKPIGAEFQGKPIGAKCQGQSVGLGCQRKPVGQDVKISLEEEVLLAQVICTQTYLCGRGSFRRRRGFSDHSLVSRDIQRPDLPNRIS